MILAVVSVACGLSFFVWALARRAVARRESLSLFEHVWFALLCAAGVIAALGEPVLGDLDPVALGLCAFLATGRIGCLVVGCCHGQPSEVGIRYGPDLVGDGFPAWLVGVRLFPVQLVEAIGIAAIGIVGVATLLVAAPGTTFLWFLAGYAVLRFGMEGLRGDERRVIAGMSLPRWQAVVQAGAVLAIADSAQLAGPAGIALGATLVLVLAAAGLWRRRSPDRAFKDPAVLEDVREFISEAAPGDATPDGFIATRTFGPLSVAVSPAPGDAAAVHVSFALPPDHGDLPLLAYVVAATMSDRLPGTVRVGAGHVLHVIGDGIAHLRSSQPVRQLAAQVHADAVRSMQASLAAAEVPEVMAVEESPPPAARRDYFDWQPASQGEARATFAPGWRPARRPSTDP